MKLDREELAFRLFMQIAIWGAPARPDSGLQIRDASVSDQYLEELVSFSYQAAETFGRLTERRRTQAGWPARKVGGG